VGERRRRGFTLIELLVVIAVISILASLLMPMVLKAMAQSQKAQCKSNLSQLYRGLQLYAGAHEQLLPPYGYYEVGASDPYNEPWWTQTTTAWLNASVKTEQRVESIIRCPSWTGARSNRFRGLTCNFGEIFRYYTPALLDRTIFHGPGSIQMTKITKPSNTLLLMDGRATFCYSPSIPGWGRVDDWDGDGILDTRSGTAAIYSGGAPFRHDGTCNVLWVDGHVVSWRARKWLTSVTEWDPYQ